MVALPSPTSSMVAIPSLIPPFNVSLPPGLDNRTLFQIYCVNPAPESCPYGPCPNSDITGSGQQLSLYITATIFAITLVHDPASFRVACCGYLANVYSILIAVAISLGSGQLTQNDAVFVIVGVASPATLYLWFLSATHLMSHKRPPSTLARMNKVERYILITLSMLLLLLWITLFPLVFIPSYRFTFSQPACNAKYGTAEIKNLGWMFLFVSDWFGIMLTSFVTTVQKRWRKWGEQEDSPRRVQVWGSICLRLLQIVLFPLVLISFFLAAPPRNGSYVKAEIIDTIWLNLFALDWFATGSAPLLVATALAFWNRWHQQKNVLPIVQPSEPRAVVQEASHPSIQSLRSREDIVQWTRHAVQNAFKHNGCLLWKFSTLPLYLLMMSRLRIGTQAMKYISFTIEATAFALMIFVLMYDTSRSQLLPGTVDYLVPFAFTGLLTAFIWQYPGSVLAVMVFLALLSYVTYHVDNMIFNWWRGDITHILCIFLGLLVSFSWLGLSPLELTSHIIWIVVFWLPKNQLVSLEGLHSGIFILITPLTGYLLNGLAKMIPGSWATSSGSSCTVQNSWPIAWVVCACKPSRSWSRTRSRIWSGTVHASPMFKFLTLVVGPSVAWISATIATNPIKSSSSSFGQICAMVTSICSIFSLAIAISDHRREVYAALFLVKPARSGVNTNDRRRRAGHTTTRGRPFMQRSRTGRVTRRRWARRCCRRRRIQGEDIRPAF